MSSRRARLRRSPRSSASSIALRVGAVLLAALLILTFVGSVSAFALVQTWLKDLPNYKAKNAFDVAQATRIYSADGKLLARLYLENRETVPLENVSPYLVRGVIAVEDERFYEHHGVDPVGLMRAVVRTASGDRQGASTITQQYVRNTILLDERTDMTLARKIREAYLALELEKRFSKHDILEMYLNTIYLGEGAYGAESAARTYFATSAKSLSLPQAALIAGLAQSPSGLDPYDNPKGAIARRGEVLGRMLANNFITQAQYKAAMATKLKLKREILPLDGIYRAPYFVAQVKKQLQQEFSPAVVFKGGMTIYTTLDTKLQGYAEAAVKKRLGGSRDPETALVSIDPRTGYVKALVGGRDYHKSKFNLATQGQRQPGSSFKTFVLVTALEMGMPPSYHIDSSSPAVLPTKPKPWVVNNSEGAGNGMMSLSTATHLSVNTVFARLAMAIGAKDIAKTAKRMGITASLPNFPSIALGACNVTPYEMASAYGTLATGGTHFPTITITRVVDRNNKTLFQTKPHGTRVLKPEIAHAATEILKGVITQGTATSANIGRPAAGKTGTSQNNRDAWFVGYTPQLVTAVWVGYPTERTIYVNGARAFGGTVAAPIWAAFMKSALTGQPRLDFPQAAQPRYDTSRFHIQASRPRVTGRTLSSANGRLNGYRYTVEYVWSSKPKGTVLGQTTRNGHIVLRVSKGSAPAPTKPPPVVPPKPAPTTTSTTKPTPTPTPTTKP